MNETVEMKDEFYIC